MSTKPPLFFARWSAAWTGLVHSTPLPTYGCKFFTAIGAGENVHKDGPQEIVAMVYARDQETRDFFSNISPEKVRNLEARATDMEAQVTELEKLLQVALEANTLLAAQAGAST